jgi:hypothetical protein
LFVEEIPFVDDRERILRTSASKTEQNVDPHIPSALPPLTRAILANQVTSENLVEFAACRNKRRNRSNCDKKRHSRCIWPHIYQTGKSI